MGGHFLFKELKFNALRKKEKKMCPPKVTHPFFRLLVPIPGRRQLANQLAQLV